MYDYIGKSGQDKFPWSDMEYREWPEEDDPLNVFKFFAECPDIRPPENMQDLPRYSQALYRAGHVAWSDFFVDYYDRLCRAIEEEVTIGA